MKKSAFTLFLSVFFTALAFAAEFRTGENPTVSKPVHNDLYVAGGVVNINAAIYGDLIAAGGTVNINDTVLQDVLVAGGSLFLNGHVGDDIRVAGGTVVISGTVEGDVIVAGGQLTITKTARIKGDLVITGGDITFDGEVNGMLKARGGNLKINGSVFSDADIGAGKISFNGSVKGRTSIAAEDLVLGENASFDGDILYWTGEGKVDFSPYQASGTAKYDESLKMEDSTFPGWLFIILYFLSAVLLMFLTMYLFRNPTSRAGIVFGAEPVRSLGWGILYIIGVPLAAIIVMVTVIAIPLSLIALNIYLLTVLLGHIVSAVVLAQWLNHRYQKQWQSLGLLLVAVGIYLVLKVVFFIPVLGFFANLLIVSMVFGSLLIQAWNRGRAQGPHNPIPRQSTEGL